MKRRQAIHAMAAILTAFFTPAGATAKAMRIGWADLLPPGRDAPAPQKIGAAPVETDRSVTLPSRLEGTTVELSGYVLPADQEGELVYAFMLLPRRGACSHMMQPPPAQVIRVVPDEPYRLSMNYELVSITGTLTAGVEKTQLFILDGVAVIESGYRMSMAHVTRKDLGEGGHTRRQSPWRFLRDSAPE